jgi:hypothetical protein
MLVTALSTQLLVSSVVREEQLLETLGHVSHSTQHPTARVQCSKGGAIAKTVGHVSHSTQHPTARVQCSKGGAIAETVGHV